MPKKQPTSKVETIYRTADEKVFTNYEDAEAHQAQLDMMRCLVGRTITGVKRDLTNEGSYTLVLDNGTEVTFTSCGDDMTRTEMYFGQFYPVEGMR